jgi:hypothetical protein
VSSASRTILGILLTVRQMCSGLGESYILGHCENLDTFLIEKYGAPGLNTPCLQVSQVPRLNDFSPSESNPKAIAQPVNSFIASVAIVQPKLLPRRDAERGRVVSSYGKRKPPRFAP